MKFQDVENLARRLCADAGSDWSKKGTHKAHWRKLATEKLKQVPPISMAEAFMAVFGYKRVGK